MVGYFHFKRQTKTETGAGTGISSDDIYTSLRLPKTCKVFHVGIDTINVSATKLATFLFVLRLMILQQLDDSINLGKYIKIYFYNGERML